MTDRQQPRGKLLKVLGLGFGIAVGVGSVIGGGILRAPGSVAQHAPDSSLILLLWCLGGIHALLSANLIAEIMGAIPEAGGLYIPARRAFGDLGALLVGTADWALNVAGIAALSIATIEFLSLVVPKAAQHLVSGGLMVLLALSAFNLLGVREGSVFQNVGSCAKAALLLLLATLIFILVPEVDAGRANLTGAGFTWAGVLIAYQLIYGAYGGWHNTIYFAEEDDHSGRNIPPAIFISVVTVTAVYVLMTLALLHALPLLSLQSSPLPAALAVAPIFGQKSLAIIALLAVLVLVSCLNANIMLTPRILYGLARDSLLPRSLTRVNRGGSPDLALFISMGVSGLLILTGQFETVFLLVGAFTIVAFLVVDAAFFVLRWREPDLPRPFRAKCYPWLPAFALALDAALLGAFAWADPRSLIYVGLCLLAAMPFALFAAKRARNFASVL